MQINQPASQIAARHAIYFLIYVMNLLISVVDQATTVLGETDTLIHLLACFVECGKLKQARKIVCGNTFSSIFCKIILLSNIQ